MRWGFEEDAVEGEEGCAELGGLYEVHIPTASFARMPRCLADSKEGPLVPQCPGSSDSPLGSEYRTCTVRKQALISSY